MKIGFLKNFAMAALAAITLLACEKDKSVRPTVSIMSEASFNKDYTAEVTVVLSSAIKKDLTVNLAVSSLSAPGTTAVPGSHLQFPATVTIAAEATSVTFTATLDPDGLSADAYSAGIQVLGGNGYYVDKDGGITYIKYDGSSYSGEGGGGEGEEGGGGSTQLSLQSNWTVSITGTELEFDEEDNAYIEGFATAPGSSYLYFETFTDEELAQYAKGDIATIIPDLESDIAAQLAKGSKMDDLLYEAGGVYIPYYDAGETYVYMLDFDTNGKSTGKYGKVRVVMPEVEESGFDDYPEDITSASLQSNWKLTFTETYYDEDDGWLDVLKVAAPGATYLDLTWLDDEDLAEYDDDLDVLNDVQFYDNFMYYEDYASTPTKFFYVDKEDAYYEHEAGTWTVFLIDFNADWTLTGKYGKCTVTIPTNAEADAAAGTSSVARKPLWQKYNRHFISSRAIRKDAPKGLLHNIKRIK